MRFYELAQELNTPTYPQQLEDIFEQVAVQPALIKRENLERMQECYGLYGAFYEDVLRGWEDLETKPLEFAWTQTAANLLLQAPIEITRPLQFPPADQSPARDMIPLFVLTARVEWAIAEYQKRGFSYEEAVKIMADVFVYDIHACIRHTGRPGINRSYYDWTTLFVYCILFPCGGFQFNFKKNAKSTTLLRHKKTGALAVLLDGLTAHSSGQILGSHGCTDERDAFPVTVKETDTEWIGHAINAEGLLQRDMITYPKAEWELLLAPGECMLGIHIPQGISITQEETIAAIEKAFQHAATYYKEYQPKAIHCGSWLLNPKLGDVIGENSKIARFGVLFQRYPAKSDGRSVFGFVFRTNSFPKLEELAEDTSLQRKLKRLYMEENWIHNFSGFYVP